MLKRSMVSGLVVTSLLLSAPAHAWDWDKSVKKLTNEIEAAFTGKNPAYAARETTVFGPVTYVSGESNITKTFSGDRASKFKLRVRSNDPAGVSFTINKKKYQFTLNGKQKKHDQTIQLELTNSFTLSGVSGKSGAAVTISVTSTDIQLPPDPVTVAPPIAPTGVYDLASGAAFIYSGANPIQTGVELGTIKPLQVSIIRGRLVDGSGNPLYGVAVDAIGNSDYGTTLSRINGEFDFAVNGGTEVLLSFRKPGYLPAFRKVDAMWREYEVLGEDVALLETDARVSVVSLGQRSRSQLAFGSTSIDQSGSRKAAVYFPSGSAAALKLTDGSLRSIDRLSFRATEYSVGPNGPQKLPVQLPDYVPYTYAVSLSSDEAIASDAVSVEFSNPVFHYVENFLGVPVGTDISVGYLNESSADWLASDNGRVIRILSISGGRANLDLGEGRAATATELAQFSISDDERTTLALNYPSGTSLWRTPLKHFSSWSFGLAGFNGTEQIKLATAKSTSISSQCPTCKGHGRATVEAQTVFESLPVYGTGHTLNYTSSRSRERRDDYKIKIPLSGPSVGQAINIYVQIEVAGQGFRYGFPAIPNQSFDFTWNGRDAYGREVHSSQLAFITLEYEIPNQYYQASRIPANFGSEGLTPLSIPMRWPLKNHMSYWAPIGTLNSSFNSTGGWTFDVHHAYDFKNQTIYRGDGGRQVGTNIGGNASVIAGNGTDIISGDGGPAIQAGLRFPISAYQNGIGEIFVPDRTRVRKIKNGIITQHAGGGSRFTNSDLASAGFGNITSMAGDSKGRIYVADTQLPVIRRLSGNQVQVVAGTVSGEGTIYEMPGDPQTAVPTSGTAYSRAIYVGHIARMAVSDDEFIFYSEQQRPGIVQIDVKGRTAKFLAGTQSFAYVSGMVFSKKDQVLIVAAEGSIYKIPRNGSPTKVYTNTADIIAASVGVDDAGTIYFTSTFGFLYRLEKEPFLINLPVTLGANSYLYFMKDQSMMVAEPGLHQLRRVEFGYPGFAGSAVTIPSTDGSELYDFDSSGRHISTRDGRTFDTIFTFGYDSEGNLLEFANRAGRIIPISGAGTDQRNIVSPDGVQTALTMSGGLLRSLRSPKSATFNLGYRSDLLTAFSTPRASTTRYEYDQLGRLTSVTHPNGGIEYFDRTERGFGNFAVTHRNEVGVEATHVVDRDSFGVQEQSNFSSEGTFRFNSNTVGTTYMQSVDGTSSLSNLEADPIFGLYAGFQDTTTITSPQGSTASITKTREVEWSTPRTGGLDNTMTNYFDQYTMNEKTMINGVPWTRTFDSLSRQDVTTSPVGRESFFQLDSKSRVSRIKNPDQMVMNLSYDGRGNLSSIAQGSRTSSFQYDGFGYLNQITDSLGRSTTFNRDLEGKVLSQSLPGGRVVAFDYDEDGNVTSIKPPDRPEYTFEFNGVGQQTSFVVPQGGQTTIDYRADRSIAAVHRPDGRTLGFTYSSASGQLTNISTPEKSVSVQYNGVNPSSMDVAFTTTSGPSPTPTPPPIGGPTLLSEFSVASFATAANQRLDFAWDGFLPKSYIWSGELSGRVDWSYDNNFRPRIATPIITLPNGATWGGRDISYHYDADGLFTGNASITLTRDPSTGLVSSAHFIDPEEPAQAAKDTFGYNTFGELTNYSVRKDSGTELYRLSLTRDNGGRISSRTRSKFGVNTNYSYGYDPSGRLTSAVRNGVATTYTYDSNGNRLTQSTGSTSIVSTYNNRDQLLTSGAFTYLYNANGERAAKINSVTGETTEYRYDTFGNLTHVILPDGRLIEYVLDGMHRRVLKKINGIKNEGYIYLDALRVAARYGYAPGIRGQFYAYPSKSNVPEGIIDSEDDKAYRVITDERGTPQTIIDGSNGTVVANLEVDEFGKVLSDTNPRFFPFKFAGCLYDVDTRLCHFGARDYDPEVGRWLQRDPIGFDGGDTNLYGYVINDPVNYMDPDGLARCTYSVSGTTLSCVSNDGKDSVLISGQGTIFSGSAGGLNRPAKESVAGLGPVPAGEYSLMPHGWRNKNEMWWHLSPDSKTTKKLNRYGRSPDMYLHPGSFSAGCITVDRENKDAMRRYKNLNDMLSRDFVNGGNTISVGP